MTTRRIFLFFILSAIMLMGGCGDLFDTNIPSEFPADLMGYHIVIYNTETLENPDNLKVSSRTVYWFQSPNKVYGEGTYNSGPLPVDSWNWDYDKSDGTLPMM